MNYDDALATLINNALREDIGDGDHSTLACISEASEGRAILKVKQKGILAGVDVAERIFMHMQPDIRFIRKKVDGECMSPGEIAFEVNGLARTILSCERLVLNCMQRMSGIATLTNEYVQKISGYHTKLLDTRKTTPNFRLLEKEAVRIGGGTNHRFGLYDMIMLKDNHIDYCGGITAAIERANLYIKDKKPGLKIEIETRSLDEVKLVLQSGNIHRIMLDNFTPAQVNTAIELIDGTYETEASGGINLSNIEEYAATGVDFVSCGGIIHAAVSIDLSLKASIN